MIVKRYILAGILIITVGCGDKNTPPEVDAGAAQVVAPGAQVTLVGTAEGAVTVNWTQVSGTAVTLATPSGLSTTFTAPAHPPGEAETLVFVLKAADEKGLLGLDFVTVQVCVNLGCGPTSPGVNDPPAVSAGNDQAVTAGDTVTLDGVGTDDKGVVAYQWAQVAGPVATLTGSTSAQVSFTAPDVARSGAQLVFSLTVRDAEGLIAIDFVTVDVAYRAPVAPVKHLILMIGDGMHLEHEIAYSRYNYGWDFAASWHSFPYRNFCTTWDATTYNRYAFTQGAPPFTTSSFDPYIGYDPAKGGVLPSPLQPTPVLSYFLDLLKRSPTDTAKLPYTDSASSATALATGYKTDDGNIAWLPGDPADGALVTIAERARSQKGMAIGVASTVPFTHATPAAFVSHNVYRNNNVQIGSEIVQVIRPDVTIGAGHPYWLGASPPTYKYLGQEDYDGLKAGTAAPYDGYVFVERVGGTNGNASLTAAADAAITQNKRLLGLFGGAGEHFEHPIAANAPGSPDYTWTTGENPSLATVTTQSLRVLKARGGANGFFAMIEGGDIDWANHGRDYARMISATWQFDEAVKAVIAFVDQPGDDIDWTNTLLIVTADHANGAMRVHAPLAEGALPAQTPNADPKIIFDYPDGELAWLSPDPGGHTNELVSVQARGAGLEYFAPYEGNWYPGTRLLDNTHIYRAMMDSLGLQ